MQRKAWHAFTPYYHEGARPAVSNVTALSVQLRSEMTTFRRLLLLQQSGLFLSASMVIAAGVIDNSVQASSLATAALALPVGDYTFRSYSNSLYLSFVDEGNGVIPDGNSSWVWSIGQMQDDQDGRVNGTGVVLTSSKKRTLRANNAGDPKCKPPLVLLPVEHRSSARYSRPMGRRHRRRPRGRDVFVQISSIGNPEKGKTAL